MPTSPTPVRFGVIGLNHNHIFEMTELLLHAGGQQAHAFLAAELALRAEREARRIPSHPELALA